MADAFGLLITGILLVTGAVGIVSPGTLCDLESGVDIPPGPPSEQRLREMRVSCLIMFVLAASACMPFSRLSDRPMGRTSNPGRTPVARRRGRILLRKARWNADGHGDEPRLD